MLNIIKKTKGLVKEYRTSKYRIKSVIVIFPGPKVIKHFSYSTQLNKKLILLINVKMATIVDILTFVSRINTQSECIKQGGNIFQNFAFKSS